MGFATRLFVFLDERFVVIIMTGDEAYGDSAM